MEVKKNPKVDLQNRRTLFLEIGLVIAIGLMIIVFSISQREKVIEVVDLGGVADEIEMIEITQERPPETQPVQQTVQVIADVLNVVKNDAQITTTFDFVDFDMDDIIVQPVHVETEEIDEDTPFLSAEKMPTFMGGDLNTFKNWATQRYRYPQLAADNGIQGRITISFVIEKDGSLTNIEVLQTVDKLLSDEAVRIVSQSPKWEPGRQRDQPVRIKYIMPWEFKIQN